MVVYEVNLVVDAAIAEAFRAWLPGHLAELLAVPGFESAQVFAIEEPVPAAGTVGLCVQYRLRDRAALDAYLCDHAGAMRAAAVARFGDRFRATRRVLGGVAAPARAG